MMGIKKAIDSTLDFPLLDIYDKDYNIKCQYELAPYRTSARDNIKACTFYDYAPQVFASIRKTFQIKKDLYSKSLGPDNILGYMFNANFQPLAELISSGKSGSFFYYTSDGKFVLKTISRAEFKFIKRILKEYHTYLTNENTESIISKIYGLHKIIFYRKKTAKTHKKIYFAIMNNVFHTSMKIDKRYDLKGSTQGRQTILKEGVEYDPTIALKDLDLLQQKEKFKIDGEIKKKLF
jgi:1-phosphatidylinositol-4-phosphate 5-kinase